MEFTKENVIKLLTDAKDLMNKFYDEDDTSAKKFAKRGRDRLANWYEGKSVAFNFCKSFLDDIIILINDYMEETHDYIDKENTNA